MSRNVRRSAVAVLTFIAGALLLCSRACRSSWCREFDRSMDMGERPECPHSWERFQLAPAVPGKKESRRRWRPSSFPANGELELPGLFRACPALRSCQRFIVQDDSAGAERYASDGDLRALRLDAAFYSATNHSTVIRSKDSGYSAVAAEGLRPLDIARGFNCLALRLVGKDYWAMMVARHTESTCGPLPTDSAWEQRRSTLPVDDIPAGNQARSLPLRAGTGIRLNGRQYIGITAAARRGAKCIQRDGFQSSPTHAIAGRDGGPAHAREREEGGTTPSGWPVTFAPDGRPEDLRRRRCSSIVPQPRPAPTATLPEEVAPRPTSPCLVLRTTRRR